MWLTNWILFEYTRGPAQTAPAPPCRQHSVYKLKSERRHFFSLKNCTNAAGPAFTSYTHQLHISGSRLLIQHSYTELQATFTVWWSPHLATALLHCSTSHASRVLFWQQHFFRRPTNISKRVCVVPLAPKQLTRSSALQVDCQTRIAL